MTADNNSPTQANGTPVPPIPPSLALSENIQALETHLSPPESMATPSEGNSHQRTPLQHDGDDTTATGEEISVGTSAIMSQATLHQIMFKNASKHTNMENDVATMLQRLIAMPEALKKALETQGYVHPSSIVNNLGAHTRHVAEFIIRTDINLYSMPAFKHLVMFARWQLKVPLNHIRLKQEALLQNKKRLAYKTTFLSMTTDDIEQHKLDFLDAQCQLQLKTAFRHVKKDLRRWLKASNAASIMDMNSLSSSPARPPHVVTVEETSNESPSPTNPAHGITSLPQQGSRHPQLPRIEEAIQSTPTGMMHLQNIRLDDAQDEGESNQHGTAMPTPYRFKPTRQKSFGTRNRRHSLPDPISPLDPNYVPGCNDDADSFDATSVESAQTQQSNTPNAPMAQIQASLGGSPQLTHSTTTVTLLKRASLPITTTWDGTGKNLERFISTFEGHVAQQQHMSYLLLPPFIVTWLKHGQSPRKTLQIARSRNVHFCLRFVSDVQLLSDISWLFAALKQALQH